MIILLLTLLQIEINSNPNYINIVNPIVVELNNIEIGKLDELQYDFVNNKIILSTKTFKDGFEN